jgi:hypothetical protein
MLPGLHSADQDNLFLQQMETEMKLSNIYLLPNERTALVEALRRDIQNERDKAAMDPAWMDYHLFNVRLNMRILEAFGYRVERDALPAPSSLEHYSHSTIRYSS